MKIIYKYLEVKINHWYLCYLVLSLWPVQASNTFICRVKIGQAAKKHNSRPGVLKKASIAAYITKMYNTKKLKYLFVSTLLKEVKEEIFRQIDSGKLVIPAKAQIYMRNSEKAKQKLLLSTIKKRSLKDNQQIFNKINSEPQAFVDVLITTKKRSSGYIRVKRNKKLFFTQEKRGKRKKSHKTLII